MNFKSYAVFQFLTKRAAALQSLDSDDFRVLHTETVDDIFEGLYKLSLYSFPDTIALPPDYVPPAMAVASCYWTVSCPFYSHGSINTTYFFRCL
jgi:hypothetical protein